MFLRRAVRVVASIAAVTALILVVPPAAQAKARAGSVCSKLGSVASDAAGRKVVCKKKGSKKIWQVQAVRTKSSGVKVGSPCSKLGSVTGDGPGRSLVCTKKGTGMVRQVLNISGSSQTPGAGQPTGSPQTTPTSTAACSQPPQFSADFIDPRFVRVVTPIGEQTGYGGVLAVRSYIHPASEFTGQELPIYAPVDMTLTSANYYKAASAPATYQPEYSLYFDVGCGVSVRFFHIKGTVGKVAGVVPTVPTTSSAGQNVTPTQVKAGEQIGWYKLGENSVAFDFWVDDASHTNNFIVPSHFASSNALHSVCPYDFYVADKRAQWLAKLGGPGGFPVAGTSCGVVTEGQLGTADGMWFISPTTETDRLTYDGAYQSQIMLSTDADGIVRIGGLNISPVLAQMMVGSQSPTWRKPSDVSVGATQCWSNDTQSVRVTVTSDNTMSVIVGTGSCSSLPDSSAGKTYYR
ncbi:MAG TPA: hypothetical protein VMV52_10800 [Candidatus Nanopelagicaceae bacterium]|nr:hypothetical protein [Candidatus Nanopelagicaceae bacterium]